MILVTVIHIFKDNKEENILIPSKRIKAVTRQAVSISEEKVIVINFSKLHYFGKQLNFSLILNLEKFVCLTPLFALFLVFFFTFKFSKQQLILFRTKVEAF